MRLDASGNLLLGTSSNSQGAKFNVQGGYVYLKETGGADVYLRSAYDGNKAAIQVASANDFIIATTNTERLRITSSGSLGIGTSTPAEKLDVYDNSASNVSIKVGNTSGALQLLQGNGAAYLYTATNQPLIFSNNNSEKMRLDASGNLYLNTTSGTGRLVIAQSNATQPAITLTTDESTIQGPSANTKILMGGNLSMYGANILTFGTGTTERARIDASGNLGINNSSPAAKLDVQGSSSDQIRLRTAATEYYGIGRNSSTGYLDFYGSQSGYVGYLFGGVNGTRMTLDASGNLGLGASPSAWSIGKAIDISGGMGLLGYNNGSYYTNNAYYNGAWLYKATSTASYYFQANNGQHQWYIAPSGTAGNAISFTQAMTLDASGNLAIGTTSTALRLNLASNSSFNAGVRMTSGANTSGFDVGLLAGTLDATAYVYQRANADMIFGTNNAERMRITSGGELLINTTSDAGDYKLQVNGDLYTNSSYKGTGANFDPTSGNNWTKAAFSTITSASPYGGGLSLIDGTAGFTFYTINNGTLLRIGSATTSTNPTTQFTLDNSGNGVFTGSIKTAAPSGGTAKPWKLGEAGVTVGGANSTAVRVEIDGTTYYLLTAYLP